MNKQCLVCAKSYDGQGDYHERCSRKFFGVFPSPRFEFSLSGLQEYAAQSVLARIAVSGVQKKLSLGLENKERDTRFTIVGLWGGYIMKPPAEEYPYLPENEDAVMRMAAAAGISVVPHAMIRIGSGERAFISRRIDRDISGNRIAMEDLCQISERLTEDKYRGSVERVGRLIRKYSAYPGLDAQDFLERVIFNYICGNSDMHLKNYSLIETSSGTRLSPAYDLVSTVLAIPDDSEESALTINGKKSRLIKDDFAALADNLGISEAAYKKIPAVFAKNREKMFSALESCFLPLEMKIKLHECIDVRMNLLFPGLFQLSP